MEPYCHSHYDHAEEDYIDMHVNSESTVFIHTKTTPPQFEFQMSSSSERDNSSPSPADELFYKGKLLPLHLPPRLQMVEKLLKNTSTYDCKLPNTMDEAFTTPLSTATNNTPFLSCANSPHDSYHVSRELNPEDYFSEYSSEIITSTPVVKKPNKSWTKKLSLIQQSSGLGSKLKASRSYLKSLFNRSASSNENSASASRNNKIGHGAILKTNEGSDKYAKAPKKTPFGQIQRIKKQETSTTNMQKESYLTGTHRRSFSEVIKRISTTRTLSSISSSESSSASSSTNSNGFKERNIFKRSTSVGSDAENPIQAAIAHCKKSQELLHSRNAALSDVGVCSLSTSRVMHEDQRLAVCLQGIERRIRGKN